MKLLTLTKYLPLPAINAWLIIYVNCHATAVHTPILVSMLLSIALGWIQPVKGWLLAIIQVILIGFLYLSLKDSGLMEIIDKDIAQFTSLMSIFTTLTGSYLGSVFKRNIG